MNNDLARVQMVSQQVRTWDVLDPNVLDAMSTISREQFVPTDYQGVAFADSRIPLSHGQVMLAPKVVGRLLQGLALEPTDRMLEIGTGSGYVTACAAHLAGHVTSIELHADLSEQAAARLRDAGLGNVEVRTDDAFALARGERFDAIALTGSLPVYDARFEQMLKVGGRLYVAVGRAPLMDACIITRATETQWVRNSLFETDVPALINAADPVEFKF